MKLGDFGISRVLEGSIEASVSSVPVGGVFAGPFGVPELRASALQRLQSLWLELRDQKLHYKNMSVDKLTCACFLEVLHVSGGVRKQTLHIQE